MRFFRAASVLLLLCAPPCYLLSQSTTATTSSAKKKKKKKKAPVSSRVSRAYRSPVVSAAARASATEEVSGFIERTAGIPIENPGAMVPFFEQLRRSAKGESTGPLSILH